jgi:hypothetical protein
MLSNDQSEVTQTTLLFRSVELPDSNKATDAAGVGHYVGRRPFHSKSERMFNNTPTQQSIAQINDG